MVQSKQGARLAAAALALLAASCSAPVQKRPPALFFPPAPELPRLQFLTAFTGSNDVEPQSAFNRFVVGDRQNVRLDKPYGVAIHGGRIYVCDTNATVVVFDMELKTFGPLKGATGPGRLIEPINIAIEPDGTKYVADPTRGQVVVFDRNDDYVKAIGEPGGWRPVDAVPSGSRLYVADIAAGLVKVFDKATGSLLQAIGDQGDPSERLDRPTNLAVDRDGNLFVTDFGRFQVVEFDPAGKFVRTFGRPGDAPGRFARPKGIAVDHEGRLYVVDASFNNVQIFNRDARPLLFFGEGGQEPGNLLLPAKVTLDYDNLQWFSQYFEKGFRGEYLVLVTSQFGPRAVSIFAYGREEGRSYPTEDDLLRQIEERRKQAGGAGPAGTPGSSPRP